MLWDLCKHLKKLCPIYMEVMNEDENSIPPNYVLIQENSFDESFSEGDGISLVRKRSFNIRIHCKDRSKISAIVSGYRSVLYSNNIPFSQYGPVYSPSDGCTSINISGSYIYSEFQS